MKAGHIPGKYFIWPFLPIYIEVIPNPKDGLYFPNFMHFSTPFSIFFIYFPKFEGKGKVPKSQIKSLTGDTCVRGLSLAQGA